tara:strand:- start:716 stop:1552 length:837 start_codon:yes stop_codon:yes gene_type:complete
MPRLTPKTDTLRALFARSGNQCAFPGCEHELVNDKNQFIAQVCHIEAASEGGERFNPDKTDEENRHYNNLLLMCYAHHVETNDVITYNVEALMEIKKTHEAEILKNKNTFNIQNATLEKLISDMDSYWKEVEILNKVKHKQLDSDLVMPVNAEDSFFDLIESLEATINLIEKQLDELSKSDKNLISDFHSLLKEKGIESSTFDDIPYYENPFFNRNWERHALSTPNFLNRLKIDLCHIQVKYLELYIQQNPDDQCALTNMNNCKKSLAHYASTVIFVD